MTADELLKLLTAEAQRLFLEQLEKPVPHPVCGACGAAATYVVGAIADHGEWRPILRCSDCTADLERHADRG